MSTPLRDSSRDEIFPVLTPAQQARVLAHGSVRKVMAISDIDNRNCVTEFTNCS